MRIARASVLFIIAFVAAFPCLHTACDAANEPTSPEPDPVEDAKQVEVLLDQRDQKMLAQLRANRPNEVLYYRGRKRSEVMKALGLAPSAPSPSKPSANPDPVATAPSLPLGPCAAGLIRFLSGAIVSTRSSFGARRCLSQVPRVHRSTLPRTV